jgi:hypothetical protein
MTAISNGGSHNPLVNLFLFIVPLTLLQSIAEATERYTMKEWVKPVENADADGNPRKRKILRPCESSAPNACHRAKEGSWTKVTAGFIIAFLRYSLPMVLTASDARRSTGRNRRPDGRCHESEMQCHATTTFRYEGSFILCTIRPFQIITNQIGTCCKR